MNRRDALVLLSGLLAGCGVSPAAPKEAPTSAPSEDAALVAAVRRAAEAQRTPEEIEAYVGRPATINTLREPDKSAFKRADLGADEGAPAPPAWLPEARAVVYWVRPLPAKDPRLVGLAWRGEEPPALFFAVIYPP
jgi:hypothetical protein